MPPAESPHIASFPAELLAGLSRTLTSNLAPANSAELLRQAGYDMGEPLHRLLRERALDDSDETATGEMATPDFWAALTDFFAALGWGELSHQRLHDGVAALDAPSWIEAAGDGSTGHPACHFTTGVFADLLRRVAGREVAVLEVECRRAGDERCRFLFGSETVLQRVYDRVREGDAYSDAVAALDG